MSSDFDPEDMDMDMDFDEEDFGEEDFGAPVAKARMDVYTMLLFLSAVFYVMALVATLAEMKPYCEEFMWNLF